MWTIHLPESVVCNPVERSRLQKTTIITTWRVERDASCSSDSCLLEKSNGGQTPLDANDKSLLIRGALIVIYREVKHCRRKSQRGHRLNCTVIILSHHNVPQKIATVLLYPCFLCGVTAPVCFGPNVFRRFFLPSPL